jgi:hypothetical protein
MNRSVAARLAAASRVAAAPPRAPRGGWTPVRTNSFQALAACFVLASALCYGPAFRLHSTWPFVGKIMLALVVPWVAITVPGGFVDQVRRRRVARARRARPREPWLWDHGWNPGGETHSSLERLFLDLRPRGRRDLLTSPAVLWAFALAPMYVIWLFPWRLAFSITAPMTGYPSDAWLTFPLGALATVTLWRWWRFHGDGTSHVTYTSFPFAPGERVTLHFGVSDGGVRFTDVEFALRHVREVATGPLGWRHGAFSTFEIVDRRPPGVVPAPGDEVIVEFDVPPDAPGTSLSSALPHYWVLDVTGRTASGEFRETFLVPIYERPALPAA